MKVTVLLAVHNGEPYVRHALESVLAQTLTDFELVVVDDASTDDTVDIVRSLGDDRVRLIRNERNVGQVPSLNRGLVEARGEYVARIDADDWCRPDRLRLQTAVLDAAPTVGLVGSWLELVDERNRHIGRQRARLDDFVGYVYATLIMRVYVAHPAAMFRRDAVLAIGGYDEATGPSEDKDLWRRLLLAGWDARIVPEYLVAYRLHDRQLSQTRSAYQRKVDVESQDRFLSALAPGVPVAGLRLLLDGRAAIRGTDAREALSAMDTVLTGAVDRFGLRAPEAAALEKLVAMRMLRVAARRPWHVGAGAIIGHSLRRLPRRALATSVTFLLWEPIREGIRVCLRNLARASRLAGVQERRRRLRFLRRVYGKLVRNG